MNLNNSIYTDEISPHSIMSQWRAQSEAMSIISIIVDPLTISDNKIIDFGTIVSNGSRFIILDTETFKANHEFYSNNNIEYHKEYSLVDFMNLTGMTVWLIHNGLKANTLTSFITIHAPTKCMMRITDSDKTLTGYSLFVKKTKSTFKIWANQTAIVNLSYQTIDIAKKVYFINGSLTHIPFISSNGYSNYALNATGCVVEEFTLSDIFFNGMTTAIGINNRSCLSFDKKSNGYINPDCVFYTDTQYKQIKTSPHPQSYRHFEVDSVKEYYAVVFHKISNQPMVGDSLWKFENIIGTAETTQSICPSSFFNKLDGLLDPIITRSDDIDNQIKKAMKFFPDLFKHILEKNKTIDIVTVAKTSYQLANNNSDVYPVGDDDYIIFSTTCRRVDLQKGYGAGVVFSDGIQIPPLYYYEKDSQCYAYYDDNLLADTVIVWQTGYGFAPNGSTTITVPADITHSMTVTLPPITGLGSDVPKLLVVSEDWVNNAYEIISGWSCVNVDTDVVELSFPVEQAGRTLKVYSIDVGYHEYNFRDKQMAFELPWYMLYAEIGSLFVFTGGCLNQNYKIIPPVTCKLLQIVPMGINYPSDVVNGEDVYLISAPYYDLYEERDTLSAKDGIITLSNKAFPFSKKYMIVFVNGKLVSPNNIVEVSSYKFILKNIKSFNDLRIYKLRHDDPSLLHLSSLFQQVVSDWDVYINSKTYKEQKKLTRSFDLVNTDAVSCKPNGSLQYMYEILHKFVLTETRYLMDETAFEEALLKDFAPIVNDGRIILDANRRGGQCRYPYGDELL